MVIEGKIIHHKKIITSGGIPFVNAGHLNGRAIEFEAMNYITPEKYEKLNSENFNKMIFYIV